MLVIWSGAKTPEIKNAFGKVLGQNPVEYRIHPDPHIPPDVEEGDVVLACGSKVLEALMSAELVPKNRTVTSMREKPIQASGATIIITYDPNIVSKDYSKHPELVWDCRLACRLIRTGSVKPVIGNYRYVESFHELINRIEEKYEQTNSPVEVACDLETLGLDEYNPDAWIITIQLSVDAGKSDVCYFEKGEKPVQPVSYDRQKLEDLDYWEGLWVQIHWLLTTHKVSIRGANYKFDSRWLNQKWGIYTSNHKFDTLLVGSLLDENRSNSLKLHAKIYTDLGGYEDEAYKYDFARVDLIPKEDLLDYAGADTDATLQVAEQMRKELRKDKKLTNFYVELVHPSSKVFEKMERNGVLVDEPYYNLLQAQLEKEKTELETKMVSQLPDALYDKHQDKIQLCIDTGKNPMGSTILKDYLFTPAGLNLKPLMVTEKTKQPSTAIDHLLMFGDNPVAAEFVQVLKEYGSVTKTLSTYVIGFLKHLRSDGRFHPSYMLFRGSQGDEDSDSGAVTGRTSAKSPAVQTISKHTKWAKPLRRAFIAPEGKTILQADYAQGELKIAACVANEPTMILAYQNGIDLHAITAATLNSMEYEEFMEQPEEWRDAQRSLGKAGNFGLLYGMSAGGFKAYAENSYGVKMTDEDATNRRNAFFDLYPKLLEWHETYRQLARDNLQVVSPLGRVRHLPLIHSNMSDVRSSAERQSINSPIQSTLSDLMQLAMVHIDREYGQSECEMFLMTHDSLAMYIPIGQEALWAKRVTDIMSNLPVTELFGWKPQLKFTADAEISVPDADGIRSLASLKKFKDY